MQTEEAEIARIKLQLLSLQYQLNNNKMLAGYGMQCPLLKTKDVTELSSLQVFEYGLFGFRIGISLYGSKYAKDVIIKYASAVQVSIEKRNSKKRKTKEAPLFIVNNGKYIFDGQEIILQGIDIQKNNDLVIRMLDSLMSLLDDVQNNIILNIEMVTDSGAKKKERFQIQLTHCHRALMVYELGLAKEEFGKLYK